MLFKGCVLGGGIHPRGQAPRHSPSKSVEGYGAAIYAGAHMLQDTDSENSVLLKFEGSKQMDDGYGNRIIEISVEEFKEHRVYPEQVPDGEPIVNSTVKRDRVFAERFDKVENES